MKTLLTFIAIAFAGICVAADAPAPRILTLTGTPHPKVEIQSVDAPAGVVMFRWLNAQNQPVDTGHSIAKFEPVAPVPPVPPATTPTYPAPSDETLKAAIEAAAH